MPESRRTCLNAARTWILILVLASVQALVLAPHKHAIGVEEQACVACQATRAATAEFPSSPALILPLPEPAPVEKQPVSEALLLSPLLERGNPRSPPAA